MTEKNPLNSLALKGYRSFGPKWQHFRELGKVNILIGQNNCGKSNVLHFINDWLGPFRKKANSQILKEHDRHLPDRGPLGYGFQKNLISFNKLDEMAELENLVPSKKNLVLQIFKAKADIDKDSVGPWFYFDEQGNLQSELWLKACSGFTDNEIYGLWHVLRNMTGGERNRDWTPGIIASIQATFPNINSALVPAIRMIGKKDSISEEFSGDGIIEKLAKLQNPKASQQRDRQRFEDIEKFLRSVTSNDSAKIEIPYERDTILVHMDGKVLPLESLGSGIHEVIILASAATVLQGYVVCMEEPELHLNPILQKKLVRYLQTATTNQYFITTHSAALMDTPNAEVYHITLKNGESAVERVTSDKHRSEICQDLGYHPSDLLQTNSIIWVEGPSDRIYLNWWIRELDSSLIEGIHYSIMFYGGRLASHLSADEEVASVEDFISLRRLNRRGAIVIDSDKASVYARINGTKKRLRDEFDKGPGFAWVTEGREIENYIGPLVLEKAIRKIHPKAIVGSSMKKYENSLAISGAKGKQRQASKVAVATEVTASGKPDLSIYDLRSKINELLAFIRSSNPGQP